MVLFACFAGLCDVGDEVCTSFVDGGALDVIRWKDVELCDCSLCYEGSAIFTSFQVLLTSEKAYFWGASWDDGDFQWRR